MGRQGPAGEPRHRHRRHELRRADVDRCPRRVGARLQHAQHRHFPLRADRPRPHPRAAQMGMADLRHLPRRLCFGAGVEISLATAYSVAQTFGWNWGEDEKPAKRARFSLTYTVMIFLSIIPLLIGVDPLKQTMFSMALTAVVLPLAILPFLLLLNDEGFVGTHRNGPIGNTVVAFTIFMAAIIALVAIRSEE